LSRENCPSFTCSTILLHPLPQVTAPLGRDPVPTRHIVSAIMVFPPFWTLKPGIYRTWDTVEHGELPFLYLSGPRCPTLDHKVPTQVVRDPGHTRHIMSAIMVVSPFSTLKPRIYRAWDAVEQGEPSFLDLSRLCCPTFYHKSPHSWVATPGPRDTSCRGLWSSLLFQSSNLGYIGRGVLWTRGNHPVFTCLDPAVQFSITRSPTVWSRRRAHATFHVGDYSRSPFLDPQTWDV